MYYRQMYFLLFNAATDAIEILEHNDASVARRILISAQRRVEELYIEAGQEDEQR